MSGEQRVAIITGASKGIGEAVAYGLAQDGCAVALLARSESKLSAIAHQIREKFQVPVAVYPLDVGNEAQIQEAVERILGEWGRIDLLFNNAAINFRGTLEPTHDQYDELLKVNVRGPFAVLKAVVPHLKRQKSGYIFNVASVAAKTGFASSGAYCSTKFALLGLSESLFHELVPLGIKVTALCPSWVNTEMASYAPFSQDLMIQKEDIMKTVRYLLSLSPNACPKEVVINCVQDVS